MAGFDSTIASVAYPARFSDLTNAYVITPSVSADQKEFFHYPNYTQDALTLFTTAKSEYSLGQLSKSFIARHCERDGLMSVLLDTNAAPLLLPRENFNKPVLVVTGENDAPYCEFLVSLFPRS